VSETSFAQIYEEYFAFVWRSLRALGVSRSALDDATQDVFVVVHRRLSDFEGRSSLKTWLFGIACRVAANHRRSRERTSHEGVEVRTIEALELALILEGIELSGVRRRPRWEPKRSNR